MGELARTLIILGTVLLTVGLLLLGIQKFPFLGKLPGDILVKRENFTVSFPLATGIIISILISLVFYLMNKFR